MPDHPREVVAVAVKADLKVTPVLIPWVVPHPKVFSDSGHRPVKPPVGPNREIQTAFLPRK